jgi:hypothetical protein
MAVHLSRRIGLLLGLLAVQAGCQRGPEGSSKLVIQAPSKVPALASSKSSQESSVSSMGLPPSGRKACYGVSVSASDIPSNSQSCGPDLGIVAGFVEAGGTVEVQVPRGSDRRIQLYLYLEGDGENTPCPAMGRSFSSTLLPRLYLIGEASGVSLQNAVEDVTINASFPGLTMTIAKQLNLPSSCTVAGGTGSSPSRALSSGGGVAAGAGMRLTASVGRPAPGSVATGGGYRLKAKVGGK